MLIYRLTPVILFKPNKEWLKHIGKKLESLFFWEEFVKNIYLIFFDYCQNDVSLDVCDINDLSKPEYADYWSCDKLIVNEKVPQFTKCKIVCLPGFDNVKGENNLTQRHIIICEGNLFKLFW